MEENKINQNLFDLISTKPFELLNEEERNLVLAEMQEEEYKMMFELHHSVSGLMKQDVTSPGVEIKESLLASYDRKYAARKPMPTGRQAKSGILNLLLLKVPVYQAAAAVFVAVLLLTSIYYFRISGSNRQSGVVYKLKTDTVYVQVKAKQADDIPDSLAVNTGNPPASILRKEERSGRSIKQDNDLKKFMVATL